MAEIGATLREARMRQRIDITDMEVRTKIRAKYLRALENEEWDLLPGPTYVRSFLRTYAEALDLDAKMIVEEYKMRHEPMETGELHPIRRPTSRERDRGARRGGRPRRGLPRGALVGLVLALIVVALFFVGRGADDEGADSGPVTTMPTSTGEAADEQPRERRERPSRPARSRTVRLQVVPTGPVSVCLVDARGRVLIGNAILQAGRPSRTFRSRRFRMVLGNNAVRLRINGRSRTVPPSSEPIAYEVTRSGRRDLPADRRPSCQ
jgi:hypothetical protein